MRRSKTATTAHCSSSTWLCEATGDGERTRYQPRALFRTYLYAIGFKILRAHRRKSAFRAALFGQRNSAPDPSQRDATESGLWVRRAVEKLDPLNREILLLREFEQLSARTAFIALHKRCNASCAGVRSAAYGPERGTRMSTITHPVAPEELMALLDDELPPDRAQSVSAHMGQCSDCRELAASLRSTLQTLSNWTVPTAPVNGELEERMRVAAARNSAPDESLSSKIFQRTKHWTWKHWAGGLTAAAALIVLLLGLATSSRPGRRAHSVSIPIRERGRSIAQATEVNGAVDLNQDGAFDRFSNAIPRKAMNQIQESHNRAVGTRTASGFGNGPMGKPQEREDKAMKEVQSGPMIARTVSLSIVARGFDAARTSLDGILARHNGYAAGLNVATPQGAARTLQASLRIPAPQLAAAVAELKSLGRIEAETQNGEEVTQQHADLVARLKNSRETEQRLQDVLRTRTGKVKEVLEVEEEIARVRGEIEQMEAEQQTFEHRVSFAAIDLKLAEEYKAELTTPVPSVAMQLRNALVGGFGTAFQSLLALVLFFAESGPPLLLWLMILSFPAWLLWRRYQRTLAMGSTAGV